MAYLLRSLFAASLPAILTQVFFLAVCQADEAAHWYKGQTHCHSLWSDGDNLPEMVADWYKSRGYDFLAISDHDVLMQGERWAFVGDGNGAASEAIVEKCRNRFGKDWLVMREQDGKREVRLKTFEEIKNQLDELGRFLLVQGEEISAGSGDHNVHLNAINIAERIAPQSGPTVIDTIRMNLDAVNEQAKRLGRPILTQLNHPDWQWYDISAEDMAAVADLRFFEVCNAGPWGHHFGEELHPGTEKMWDIANTIRIARMKAEPLFAIASDDAHRYRLFTPNDPNPGRGFIMVRADQLSADALLDAVSRGDFYASTGVILSNYSYDPVQRTIAVDVKAEPGVSYTIEFIGTPEGVDPTAEEVEGKNPNARQPGRRYSPEIGKVFKSVQGPSAVYQLAGNELYVRAVVHSDKPIENAPTGSVQLQEAWCQPVLGVKITP